MQLIIEIIIALILATGIYYVIHRMTVKRAIKIVQKNAQSETDRAVREISPELVKLGLSNQTEPPLSSELVADVWGRGVMAFEYTFDVAEEPSGNQLDQIQVLMDTALLHYAHDHQIEGYLETTPFLVTDTWVYEDRVHVDVAYLMNEATIEYVKDLRRLKSN
ncbi:hypothetical protein [Levilactobacillus bambusae]|uniref:Uncharacterized protein n=1 Tax=Levilactobacillus bambusae TaxID=2024736 RepID=A0A2V1N3M5_9LACO|nr:hypothetical protein [Levilactobacillus bambusae]PWG00666.1 hypothetical protein DCM90_00380 [Levilactobacillus bambusae]